MTVLLCPLCSQPRFSNLESLRLSLVNVATQSIFCPICNDVLMGLDKFTIHLFGHTLNQNNENRENQTCLQLKPLKEIENVNLIPQTNKIEVQSTFVHQNQTETCPKPIPEFNLNQFMPDVEKMEKPPEKIMENCYELELAKPLPLQEETVAKDTNLCTVNMAELSFLTSWENCVRLKQDCLKPENEYPQSSKQSLDADKDDLPQKEDSTELSEYMSDLLNKKMPILNFVFTMDNADKNQIPEKPPEQFDKKPLKCNTCGLCFQNSIILTMHEELMHSKKNNEDLTHQENSANLFCSENEKNCKVTQTDSKNEFISASPPLLDEDGENPMFPFEDSGDKSEDVFEEAKDGNLPRYDCHLCPKSFKMKGGLLVHFKIYHFGANVPDAIPISGNPGSPDDRNFHCSICSKSFKKEQHLSQHAKTHEGKQWQCETCSKHFTTKYFLKKHQRLHTGEMPYSCPACKKTFTFQQSYHKHLLYHSDEKPHQCTQCGRAFKELSTLHNHQRIHSGEKPFACETCGKCFRQRVSYIVHQRIHTGVLPYQCTACKKKFRYKVSQRSHKCTAQPPGIVVRQPGDLIQKILEHRNDILQCTE